MTWNAWWAHSGTDRGRRLARVVADAGADVVVLTEAEADVLPAGGHVVEAAPDWGYRPARPGRRKVLMWSRSPWSDVDDSGSDRLPSGRWVAATTDTALGPTRFAGVCIPWSGAHVSSGRKDRGNWEDHAAYLDALKPVLDAQPVPLVVAGDFNQRIPRVRQPRVVAASLAAAFSELRLATDGADPHLIDHIAHSSGLVVSDLTVIPSSDAEGRLSDHLGVLADVIHGGGDEDAHAAEHRRAGEREIVT